jgi:hypothetical protein
MEGAPPLGSLHGAGVGRHGGHGMPAHEEEAALGRCGRRTKKRPGWATWAKRPNRSVGNWADSAKI